ncbi:protein phosphatase CheZ [Dechloromonas sp. ZY10]|uniref:protein phosphatase CheZ n=1 Tax=Dechloromonas aquae TaxID=2664436 RepID=UPI00352948F4
MAATNDTPDLEALFDSIAATSTVSVAAPPLASSPVLAAAPAGRTASTEVGDNEELQELFDSLCAANTDVPVANQSELGIAGGLEEGDSDAWPKQEVVFNQIGQMARSLHDTICGLGYDKLIETAVSAIPDAKDRLAYVANLTEQAACRVLNATDVAVPVVDKIVGSTNSIADRWDLLFDNRLSVSEFKALAEETRRFLRQDIPQNAEILHAQLTEIMMAQDFQDLTGQVIKKIGILAQELEGGLMKVLLQVVPETKRTEEVESLMNGPVINAEGRSDVVVNQEQVDDLLESLGF